jgi:hypothetical protein
MADQRAIQSQIQGLRALKERLSEQSFARAHVSKLHSAAEALGVLAGANDGPERAHRLATTSKQFLDSISRTKGDLEVRRAGGLASLSQEFSERANLQPGRFANEVVQAFGKADQKDRTAWLSKIVEQCDGPSLSALQQAPEFVTGVDREMLSKFMGAMEQRHFPDLAAKRETFEQDIESAQTAIEQASRIAENLLKIEDVDSAVAARERAEQAQAQFRAATEE